MKLILVGASFAFLGSVGRGNSDATFKVRGFQEIPFPVNSWDILFTHFIKIKNKKFEDGPNIPVLKFVKFP